MSLPCSRLQHDDVDLMDPQSNPPKSMHSKLEAPKTGGLIARFGYTAVTRVLRDFVGTRSKFRRSDLTEAEILDGAAGVLSRRFASSQRPVFNLTGTVLHTNLGRASLPPHAAAAAAAAFRGTTNLEYDLEAGKRGDRDSHISGLLRELTGAEAAMAVNNNAAAVVLVLNTLALGKEVPVSRGELIEIGGAFRLPEIMSRAGAILREVGTTNRTHKHDYWDAIHANTAMLMRIHPANFSISGFTATVPTPDLASLAHAAKLPLIEDLGSGSLINLERWGLPHEPTPQASLSAGVDLVTFSGDKLLGGLQAGLIVGRADLIELLNANPFRRALRMDKGRLAALEAVLRLYLNPERLVELLPTTRLLARTRADIEATAARIAPALRIVWPNREVGITACRSQIGSGALPVDLIPSMAITVGGPTLGGLVAEFRSLPRPVIGRLHEEKLWLDCRCLESDDEAAFLEQLPKRG